VISGDPLHLQSPATLFGDPSQRSQRYKVPTVAVGMRPAPTRVQEMRPADVYGILTEHSVFNPYGKTSTELAQEHLDKLAADEAAKVAKKAKEDRLKAEAEEHQRKVEARAAAVAVMRDAEHGLFQRRPQHDRIRIATAQVYEQADANPTAGMFTTTTTEEPLVICILKYL